MLPCSYPAMAIQAYHSSIWETEEVRKGGERTGEVGKEGERKGKEKREERR